MELKIGGRGPYFTKYTREASWTAMATGLVIWRASFPVSII